MLKFNAQFKALKSEGKEPERFIESEWTGLSISFAGLQALGISPADLGKFPPEFRVGVANLMVELNDSGNSDPSRWIKPFDSPGDVHALLAVAADSEARLKLRLAQIVATGSFQAGVANLLVVEGDRSARPSADWGATLAAWSSSAISAASRTNSSSCNDSG